ncbi:MAG: LytTR family DNA-binding domain-containing protein [Roseburia sp.]|nr:LytTR family DNA-binding domain-containing protein [Roseburia sp.]MCM1097024.1 LytTR family DNA-binding domain-containing protein [Ruminococcus flavefaciens]
MEIKIAICDDDAAQREYLARIVSEWAGKNRYLVRLQQYADAEAFFFDYEEQKDFDILLLDVEMPGMSGTELARRVRRDNAAVQIVFITGYYEYFSDGFDVSALHYLLKPADEGKLFPVLERAVQNLAWRQRSVLISTQEGEIKIPLADILYAEAEKVYVMVHTVQGNYRTRMTLGKFGEQLDDTFFKVHRSYLAGLKYIKKITRTDITMLNGDVIPVSRGLYDEVHAALMKYL